MGVASQRGDAAAAMTTPDPILDSAARAHADIAPSRHKRVENDGYLHHRHARWIVSGQRCSSRSSDLRPHIGASRRARPYLARIAPRWLRRGVPRHPPLPGPAGRRHRRRRHPRARVARRIRPWVVTNLPYRDLTELTAHPTSAARLRDRCGVALLVRAEWLIPKARSVSSMSTRISPAQ